MKIFLNLIKSNNLRRSLILNEMKDLDNNNANCVGCSGPCCTYKKNSMRITVIEAIDLYIYLKENKLWNAELIQRLKYNIKEFRLDSHLMIGARNSFRRTYTCPFFKHESLGCPIPNESKPYGCLAFNPLEEGSKEGIGCESNLITLKNREKSYKDEEVNNLKLKTALSLVWDKETIPVALLDLDSNYEDVFGQL
jgi:hypothetical protein